MVVLEEMPVPAELLFGRLKDPVRITEKALGLGAVGRGICYVFWGNTSGFHCNSSIVLVSMLKK